MENQVKAITIKKEEFEWKVGEAVATSMNRMDRCMRTSKAAEDRDVMGILAVTVFHMKGIAEAMGTMEKEILKNSSLVHITEPGYDKLSMDLVQQKAKKLLETKEDGAREPMPIVVAETMAWNLAFQELRRVLFDEETSKEDEIFRSARESIRRETEKPETDLEKNLRKFGTDGGPVGQTACANTEANQKGAESTKAPEQSGLENAAPAETDVEGPVKDQTEKQAAGQFFAHIRRRFGF